MMKIYKANYSIHKKICAIAKESKYTKDFSNMIFSGEDCYKEGRIRVLKDGKTPIGFSCFRLRKRDNILVLYFLGVTKSRQGEGAGGLLIEDLFAVAEGRIVEFKLAKDNEQAKGFYKHLGFEKSGEKGEYWIMQGQIKNPAEAG